MKALIIDDDVYCLNITSEYFRYKGFEVTPLLSPACTAIVSDQKIMSDFDIIVADNRMPAMTGIDFFELLTQNGCELPPNRRILITGDVTQDEFDLATRRGYKVFHKPCPLETIDQWLEEIIPGLEC